MLNSRSIYLSWDPVPSGLQNGILRRYRVTILDSFGDQRIIITTNTSVTVAALTPFMAYNCIVAAETIALGPSTPPLQVWTPPDGKYFSKRIWCQHHVLQLFLISFALFLKISTVLSHKRNNCVCSISFFMSDCYHNQVAHLNLEAENKKQIHNTKIFGVFAEL